MRTEQEIKDEIERLKSEIKVNLEVIPREKNKAGWYLEGKYQL